MTGSLVFSALLDCLDVYCATGFTSCRTFCSTDCVLLSGFVLSLRRVSKYWTMATEGAALVDNRAGITFGVELYVPWDAPEAVVYISSEGVVPLRSIPDVIGLTGRRADAVECRILQGRDVRSVRVLVPGRRGLDQNFHDVTIVDMGDVRESSVSIPDLSSPSQQWPPVVISHMGWRQQELEGMRAAAKQSFRQTRPSSCVYCGIWIKCDMYRYVVRFHLDLAQLWRCPVSWCTVCKGTPQDCMDHVRGAHDVPSDVKLASLEYFLSPWTVRRQMSDSLKPQHSGISTDILLFSDINLSLVHHYRIHKRELPHVAFRRNYVSQLYMLFPVPVAQPVDGVLSLASTGPGSLRPAGSAEFVGKSPRTTRRAKRRVRPVCVVETSVCDLPVLTLQDPSDVQGAVVFNCRPPLLPVYLDLRGIGLWSGLPPVVSASVGVPPKENGLSINGGRLRWIGHPGSWGCSTRGLRNRAGGRAADSGWFTVH